MKECKILNKILLQITLLTFVLLVLCGCFELGDFESDETYFEYFPSVVLIDKNESRLTYSVEDYFYTEEGINDYVSNIAYKEYLYLAVEVKKDLLLNEFNLSFCSEQDCKLEVSIFILDTLPSNIRGYDEPLYDDENNKIEYDDPVEPLDSKVIYLETNKWTSSYLIDLSKNESIEIKEGQYIILRFENNSFKGKEEGLSLVTFTTTNLLIRTQGS
jgi:hypothetical protein